MPLVLGIESSCDETAAAIVRGDPESPVVLSNVIASQVPVHARFGGVVPELASRNHLTAIQPVVRQALRDADVGLEELEAIAVTQGPGLAGCLLVGLQAAKGMAWSTGLPLVPVDHIQAHVHAIHLRDAEGAGTDRPPFPYVALAVSGGHTSLMRVDAPGESVVLGQTLDDAAGEAFDKVAKLIGLPYPGGVHIDRLARGGDATRFELPRPMKHRGLTFSFSGLKTAVRQLVERLRARDGDLVEGPGNVPWADTREPHDLAASVQEAIVDVLVTKALRACKQEGLRHVVVAGGVACNSRLRERLEEVATSAGVRAYLTPGRYCTDNAAMVAGLGSARLARGDGREDMALRRLDIFTTKRPAMGAP